jgi:hypothetical protein
MEGAINQSDAATMTGIRQEPSALVWPFAFTQRLLSRGAASVCATRTRRAGACGGVGGFRAIKPALRTPVCG